MAWPNQIRTDDGVVHAPGFTMATACYGSVYGGRYVEVKDDVPVTCLWCIAGVKAPLLCWVKDG